MDIMKDCFTNAFIEKLRKMGYEAHENNESIAYIYKGEAPGRTYLCTFRNDFNLAFDKQCTREIQDEVCMLSRLRDRFAAPYKEYAAAEPFTICTQKSVRKFLDYNNIVLAAQLMSNNELHFITWDYSYNRTGVTMGHYFGTNYEAAQEDFTVRSGLIQSRNVLTKEQAKIIENACVYRYENDGNMDYNYSRLLNDTIEKLRESENEHDGMPAAEKRIISTHKNRDDAR